MKTNVTFTSITAYHNHDGKQSQKIRVAQYCINETKHNRLVWINKIAEHFAIAGQVDLAQKSTVSPRFNEIKENGVIVNGKKHKLVLMKVDRPAPDKKPVEMYWLVIDNGENNQLELF